MILSRKLITKTSGIVKVDLPSNSEPIEFRNQSGKLFLWYANSNNTVTATYSFLIASLGDEISGQPFGSIKLSDAGAIKQIFQL